MSTFANPPVTTHQWLKPLYQWLISLVGTLNKATKLTRVIQLLAPAAVSTTTVMSATAANVLPGAFTQPPTPRNLQLAFQSGWSGGNATVTGTDQSGAVQTELFTANAGATVVGVKVFSTVTGVTVATPTDTHTLAIGVGLKLGIAAAAVGGPGQKGLGDAIVVELVDDTAEAPTAVDATNGSVTMGTAPNATHNYKVIANF